jgi:hypothetical protein
MPIPNDRQSFKDYCLRRLGYPVININIEDQQLEDRIDDAMQYFQDYHFDGTTLIYAKHQITQTDIDNQYLTVNPNIIGITRIFPLDDSQANVNMFDLRYQLRLNELYDFTSASYINYTLTLQHLRTLELLFTGLTPIRFNRHMNILYIDWAWGAEVTTEDVVIMEAYQINDPEIYPDIYNNRWLKEYATACIARQWGENIRKYGNVQLPGGIILNGDRIYDDAVKLIERLEKEMNTDFGLPVGFIMG